jgi:hypothetical protein
LIVESKLAQAARHVAEGRRIVARQSALIAKKRAAGQDTVLAEATLLVFKSSLAIFEADLLRFKRRKFKAKGLSDPRALCRASMALTSLNDAMPQDDYWLPGLT